MGSLFEWPIVVEDAWIVMMVMMVMMMMMHDLSFFSNDNFNDKDTGISWRNGTHHHHLDAPSCSCHE